jgi:hypothetical protein
MRISDAIVSGNSSMPLKGGGFIAEPTSGQKIMIWMKESPQCLPTCMQ